MTDLRGPTFTPPEGFELVEADFTPVQLKVLRAGAEAAAGVPECGHTEYIFWPIWTGWEPVKDWHLAAGGIVLFGISLLLLALLAFAV